MRVYEIRPIEGGRYALTGDLGEVRRLEFGTIKEAALHAQKCAEGGEGTVRLFQPNGILEKERPIPQTEENRYFPKRFSRPLE
jgi:hypothetical protein